MKDALRVVGEIAGVDNFGYERWGARHEEDLEKKTSRKKSFMMKEYPYSLADCLAHIGHITSAVLNRHQIRNKRHPFHRHRDLLFV